ncbi:ROK family protein [Coraliomargarita sp. W4R53]
MAIQQKYDRGDIRRLNAISVLNQLRMSGPLSRANIASELGLTRATVSNIVANLISESLVLETEYVEGVAGRPGLLLELNANCGCMIALEIDLDGISLILANAGQVVLWRQEVQLKVGASATVVLSTAAALVERALECGREQGLACLGICVAWAGLVNFNSGELAYGPTSGWSRIALKADWETRFEVPVYLENEAHAAAIGMHHFGPRPGVRNLIYLSLGVGLAAGVYVDGTLLRGKHGYSGQVGHSHFAENGITCSCGKEGCWVTEIGFAAVLRKLAEAGVDVTSIESPEMDALGIVHEMAQGGDERVLHVLRQVGRQIGQGAASLVQTFNPSLVMFGGRMGKLMDLVSPSIEEALLQQTLPYMAEELEVVFRASDGDHLIGGLATVFDARMTSPTLR